MPPKTFRQLTREQFADVLHAFPFARVIDAVHMHHTWSPTHADYQAKGGLQTIVDMWRYHTQVKGWSDIAQHISIAPDGSIWTGRDWNRAPASAVGYNGSSAVGPFMFETIGNFDQGQDRLEGEQRKTVLAVIALVQERFQLAPETLRFHRQMTDQKSCPGTGVRRDDILSELMQHGPALAKAIATADGSRDVARSAPFDAALFEDRQFTDDVVNMLLGREGVRAGLEEAAELDEDLSASREPQYRAGQDDGAPRAAARETFTADDLARLAPHVVNLNQGELSSGGSFQTRPGDVDAIFAEHIPEFAKAHSLGNGGEKMRIVFFAHGGLVGESGGLAVAQKHVEWWKANLIYPIYFVWETGLCETLGQILFRAQTRIGSLARDRGIGDVINDRFTDPLLANICHTIGGVQIWGGMKYAAQRASEPGRGARYVAEQLARLLATPPDGLSAEDVELHAVGHSAGAILHSYFVPMAADVAKRPFESVQFLAPAIRSDTFKETLWRHMPPISRTPAAKSLAIYTMRDALERDDNCGPYRKSLLYLIHDGLEPQRDTEILGLERSLRSDHELVDGLVNPATRGDNAVFWSTTEGSTMARHHGDFDDDTATMNAVGRRVLGKKRSLLKDFAAASARGEAKQRGLGSCLSDLGKTRDIDDGVIYWNPSRAATLAQEALPITRSRTTGRADDWGDGASMGSGRRARRALCIGIDDYPTAPLGGCAADAQMWHSALSELGFVSKKLLNGEASRAGILGELETIVRNSAPGDVLIVQYSGHGTTVPDDTHDEEDGQDQALCPHDFAEGHLLVDDDVADVFAKLPNGVNLTCFFDCCHSGTITRFAVGDSTTPHDRTTRKARYVKADAKLIQRHRDFRHRLGRGVSSGPRAFSAARGPAGMREVVFSACRRDEVAYESDGHGEFTRRAVPMLGEALKMTNKEFQSRMVEAFGTQPSQHPILDCAPDLSEHRFLGVAGEASKANGPSQTGGSASQTANGVARLLRDVADLLGG